MALLSQAQADSAYANSDINKYIDNNDGTKCIWNFTFELDGETYSVHEVDQDGLAFGSTELQVKEYFVSFLKENCEYIPPSARYTVEQVGKV